MICHHGRDIDAHGPCESCRSDERERPSLWAALQKAKADLAAMTESCEIQAKRIQSWLDEEQEWIDREARYRAALQTFVDEQPNMPPEGGWMLRHQRACLVARTVLSGK